MQGIYESASEQAVHDGAIDALAGEMHIDPDAIRIVYERHYLRLRSVARIRDYLPVLVARRTREALRVVVGEL